MSLQLGPGIACDVGTLIDTRLLIQANSGGGKSWALRRLLELTHGKVQHLVIDPEGEFASLRERFDYVLAAKSGGDTTADPRSAALLAHRLLELGVSAIIDIYELKHHDRIRFVRGFLEALVNAPKNLWHPALVVVDEAHVFCPQQGEAESAGAVIDLATRGRKRGFCAVLATQRISKLHKDAAAECNNKLIGRSALDVDMKRAADELGFTTREQQQGLRDLEPGEFFAFGPALSRAVARGRIGQVQTSHPKAGARLAVPTPPPTSKIRALLPKLADLPAEAEEKARTEKELRQEINTLKGQLTAARRAAPAPAEPKVVEKLVLKEGQVASVERTAEKMHAAADVLVSLATDLGKKADEIVVAVRATAPAAPQPTIHPFTPAVPRNPVDSGIADVSSSQRRILNALAWLESISQRRADKTQLALLADQSPTSGGYFNNLGRLRTLGLIEYPQASVVALTDAGRAVAEPNDVPTSSAELHRQLFAKLPAPQVRILRVLIEVYPQEIGKNELAEHSGQRATSGGYFNNLGRLRSLNLIDYPGPGRVVALPALFLDGT